MSDSDVDMEAGSSGALKPDLTYDPEQDPEVKRKIRRNYRELAKQTEGIRFSRASCNSIDSEYTGHSNPNDYTAEELGEKLKRANTLFDQGGDAALRVVHFLTIEYNSQGNTGSNARLGVPGHGFQYERYESSCYEVWRRGL